MEIFLCWRSSFLGLRRTDERLRIKYKQKVIALTMTMDIQITSQYPRPNLNEKKSSDISLPKNFQGLRSPQAFLGHCTQSMGQGWCWAANLSFCGKINTEMKVFRNLYSNLLILDMLNLIIRNLGSYFLCIFFCFIFLGGRMQLSQMKNSLID